MLVVLGRLLSLLLVDQMLKQSYLTLTTIFLMVLKQLSQVLHVPQTVAPMAKALQDNFGVVEGLMTTIHACWKSMVLTVHTIKVTFVVHALVLLTSFLTQLVLLKQSGLSLN